MALNLNETFFPLFFSALFGVDVFDVVDDDDDDALFVVIFEQRNARAPACARCPEDEEDEEDARIEIALLVFCAANARVNDRLAVVVIVVVVVVVVIIVKDTKICIKIIRRVDMCTSSLFFFDAAERARREIFFFVLF